jgi:hypothetical protein
VKAISFCTEHDSVANSIGRRAIIFTAVILFHVTIIILLIFIRQTPQPQKPQGTSSIFMLGNISRQVEKPIDPIVPVDRARPIPKPVEGLTGETSVEGAHDGEICLPLDQVTSQLTNDPQVPLAIKRVAKANRSISEAIVMWNVEWSAAAADDGPLAEVRGRVISILESLPADCLSAPVSGPRLIAISENGYTTFLSFGSGEWSWQQLIQSEFQPGPLDSSPWFWEALLPEMQSS